MFKRITIILVLLFSVFYFSEEIDANLEYEINFYFDNNISKTSYFYEVGSKNYPLFEGYTFKDEITIENAINLYYETTKIKVIINGNGGLFDGEEEIIIKEIDYGETYLHNPVEINKHIFKKDGYILESYEKNFDRSIEAKEDIIYYAKWQRENTDYQFIVNNQIILVSQRLANYIDLPIITTTKNFLGFYDSDNNLYNSDYIITDLEPITLYAKFSEEIDFIINSNLIAVPRLNNENWVLLDNEKEILGEDINNYFVFRDLTKNTTYTFKNTTNNQLKTVHTKETDFKEHQGFQYQNEVYIINNSYYEYYDENGLISFSEFLFNQEIKYRIKFSNNELKELTLEDLLIITDLNIDIKVYNNEVLIQNNSGFKYSFNGIEYNDLDNIITNLKENQLYYIEFENNDIKLKKYFYTNELIKTIAKEDFNYTITDKQITINDPYLNYEYGVILSNGLLTNINWQSINDNKINFNNLLANTKYDLYVRNSLGEISLVGSINTNKKNSESVIPPKPIVEVLKITENSIILKNDTKIEYSTDQINWFSSNNNEIVFSKLSSYNNYPIYLRMKENEKDMASNLVLANYLKTLAKVPDLDAFINLFYDFEQISFSLKAGYAYYFNNELITENTFKVNGLPYNSTHELKVIRVSDGKTFIENLKLKTTSNLEEYEKNVLIRKDNTGISILESNPNFKYILKLDKKIVEEIDGNNKDIIFNVSSNKTYQLYVLKASNKEFVYLEEYIGNIYLPKDLSILLNDYISSSKYQNISTIKDIILEKTIEAYSLNDESSFNELYESAKLLIDDTIINLNSIKNKRVIVIVTSVLATISINTFILIYKKRKQVKS